MRCGTIDTTYPANASPPKSQTKFHVLEVSPATRLSFATAFWFIGGGAGTMPCPPAPPLPALGGGGTGRFGVGGLRGGGGGLDAKQRHGWRANDSPVVETRREGDNLERRSSSIFCRRPLSRKPRVRGSGAVGKELARRRRRLPRLPAHPPMLPCKMHVRREGGVATAASRQTGDSKGT